MKTAQNTPQSVTHIRPDAVAGCILAFACLELARVNPGAFASRPRYEALTAVRAAIAKKPRTDTPEESWAATNKANTARKLADRLEDAEQYDPAAFAAAMAVHGLATRAAVVETLRAYFNEMQRRARLARLRAETAAAKLAAYGIDERTLAIRRAAEQAARPDPKASAEENAKAKAGHDRLRAFGAFD